MRRSICIVLFIAACNPAAAWSPASLWGRMWAKDVSSHHSPPPPAGPTWPGGPPAPAGPSQPGYPFPSWPGGPPSGGGGGWIPGSSGDWPGWGPSPPAQDELPLTSGMVVNLYSHVLDKWCQVDAAAPYALRCEQDTPAPVMSGMLLLGTNFATNKIYDGGRIQLKSQANNKLCSVGPEADMFPVTCGDMDVTETSDFVIRRSQARDDLYVLAPAVIPSHHCYPAHSGPDHGAAAVYGQDGSEGHPVRCNGHHDGDNALFTISTAGWYQHDSEPDTTLTKKKKKPEPAWPSYPLPPFPGGGSPLPPYPMSPGSPSAGPVLPFGVGSTIQISSPNRPDLMCDVKDATTSLRRLLSKKPDAETLEVWCDRLPPSGPGAQYMQVGYTVLPEDRSALQLPSGSKTALSNLVTHKACRVTKLGFVVCDARDSDPDAQFRMYLADGKDTGSLQEMLSVGHRSGLLARLRAWLRGDASAWPGKVGVDKEVEVHLLHVESDMWCGADGADKHAALVCDHNTDFHRPRLVVKVHSFWP